MDTQSLTTDSDTQATQILENLTHGGTNMWRPPIPAAEPEPMLDESLSNYSKDNSAESSDPHSAAPRHNFYGLAIQSQYNDLSGNEDSQKENTPAPCDSRLQRPSTPGPHSVVSSASGSKTGGKIPTSDDNNRPFADTSFQTPGNATTGLEDVLPEIRNDTSRSPFKVNIALSGPSTKAVSFMSPNSKTITSAPVVAQRRGRFRPKLMRRDPSPPASQDSFIDPLPDPAKAYIATDRQFQIPLSQLGEDSLSQSSMRASSPDRISHQLPSRRDPSRSNSPSHIATVLVAATPSSSGSSNSSQDPASQDSLLYSASQDVNWYSNGQPDREASPLYPYHINLRSSAPRDNSQQSEPEVWQPTQAVDELSQSSSEDGNQFPPSTVSATQATQYQETQLISGSSGIRQEPPSADPHPLLSEPVAYSNAPSTSTKATSAVPNSLLSLVDPSKRHRYEGIVAEARGDRVPDVPMPPPRRTVPKPQTSRAAATQQTRDGSVYSINRTRTAPTESSSEVVPDSEPARLARLESSPSVPLADIRKRVSNLSREEEEDQGVATEVEENPDDHHHGPFIPPPVVNKRKGKAGVPIAIAKVSNAPAVKSTSANISRGPPSRDKTKGKPVQNPKEEEVVPSSVPGEDAKAPAAKPAPADERTLDVKMPTRTRAVSQTGKPNARGRKNDVDSDTEASDSDLRGVSGPSKRRDAVREEEEETDPGDSNDKGVGMDVDEQEDYMPPPAATRSALKKRKRSVAVEGVKTRATSRTPTVAGSYTPSVTSTAERLSKRVRTMTPGTRRLREPTRVFALWKQDGHYYPGVIHASTLEPNRYIVHFDDGTAETVEVAKMRRCQLGKGDNVLIGKGQRAKVLDAQGSDSNSMVRVEVDDRDGTENVEVTVGDIQIAGRTITSHWKDRLLVPSAIVTVQQSKMKQSPSVSHAQDMLNKAIYKTGFVISSSSTSPQVEKEKADAVSIIKTAGGVLVDDWSSVVSIDGQFSSSGNCWVAYRSGVKWSGSDDIAKIFLLSDDCTTKPKFLMALALGVPCLDIRWILAPGELDWPAYLLPAGYSESIQARISQMVDLDWGNSIDYVEDIMNNPVATKLFGNKSILCLSDKFVPIQAHVTKKKTITDGRGSLTCVPRILLAMGAIRVEAVVQTRYATERNLKAYHYIIVSELSDIDPLRGDGLSVAHWDWVKDCLISGRLLDMPA